MQLTGEIPDDSEAAIELELLHISLGLSKRTLVSRMLYAVLQKREWGNDHTKFMAMYPPLRPGQEEKK